MNQPITLPPCTVVGCRTVGHHWHADWADNGDPVEVWWVERHGLNEEGLIDYSECDGTSVWFTRCYTTAKGEPKP